LKDIEAVRELRMEFIRDFDPVASYHLPPPEEKSMTGDQTYIINIHHNDLNIDERFFSNREKINGK
jgi:hypothetical protein